MTTPGLTIIGYTTITTSRVLAVFTTPDIAAARLAFRAPGGAVVAVDATRVDSAPPCVLARFDLAGLPADTKIEYGVAGAADPGMLPAAAQLLDDARAAGAVGTFKTLPAPDQRPPRIALVSCNGVHTAPEATRYRLWKTLKREIDEGNVDMIVFGGDQIYADPIWMKHDAQDTFRDATPATIRERLTPQYREWYLRSWSPPEVRAVLSSCPSVMMWDDHDIFDGYGSHDDDHEPAAQAYFAAAKQAFSEFQASHNPDPLGPSSFAFGFELGDIAFLVLDGRSNRSYGRGRILGDAQLRLVAQHLEGLAKKNLKHLFVVTGVPIVHAPVAAALYAFEIAPGVEEAEDDLRDSWAAPNNLSETRRLLLTLFNFGRAAGTQVSILSGDVHVATVGAIESSLPAHRGPTGAAARIHQVVSSGIGYMPPSGVAGWLIKKAIASVDGSVRLAGMDIVGQLLPFQGSPHRYLLARRNFAIVKVSDRTGEKVDAHRNVWVDYYCEEGDSVVVREQCLMGA
jgi:phosphodiesterase/alkaline phosphatase D-like protein